MLLSLLLTLKVSSTQARQIYHPLSMAHLLPVGVKTICALVAHLPTQRIRSLVGTNLNMERGIVSLVLLASRA
jgi:hypothetical protein